MTGITLLFDAENKISKAVQGVTSYYYYDADAKRARTVINGAEVWQIYGFDGELVTEYHLGTLFQGTNNPLASSPTKEYGYRNGQLLVIFDNTEAATDDKLKWAVTDQLGSTRMLVNRSGSHSGIKRRDYLPFGEELPATIGHRTASGSGYPASNNLKQKFTGYERDDETGLDYAQERYFSSVQGRFTSADPLMASAKMSNPQTFNRFTYVVNNPLRFVDPDGMQGVTPWGMLTAEEQAALSGKLKKETIKNPNGKQRQETSEEAFNRLAKNAAGTDANKTKEFVAGFKNFIDGAGGRSNSNVWQQIESIDGGWFGKNDSVGIQTTVKDSKTFLSTLEKSGYDVNRWYESLNVTGDHRTSARQVTLTFLETSMHFVQQNSYPERRFDIHWDRMSSSFALDSPDLFGGASRYPLMVVSGAAHSFEIPASKTREELKKRGIAPQK